jgi:ubiquinone/menaquinone biosynthesis C-methylase UbiE
MASLSELDAAHAATETNPLLVFLDRFERRPDAVARRQRSYALLGARAGARVVDAGCGAGTAVRELAALVAPGGAAAGVDVNEPLIQTATARAAEAGALVAFHLCGVEALPFADASLDGYRAERLYQHLPEPARALAEARRALVPGGRIVLLDQDWDGMLLDSDDRATTRRILRAFADGKATGAVGYHRLLGDAGFVRVEVQAEAFTSTSFDEYGYFVELLATVADASGAVSSAVAEAWLTEQRHRGRQGRFFMVMMHVLAAANR